MHILYFLSHIYFSFLFKLLHINLLPLYRMLLLHLPYLHLQLILIHPHHLPLLLRLLLLLKMLLQIVHNRIRILHQLLIAHHRLEYLLLSDNAVPKCVVLIEAVGDSFFV